MDLGEEDAVKIKVKKVVLDVLHNMLLIIDTVKMGKSNHLVTM